MPGPMTIADTTVNLHYDDEAKLGADLAAAINSEIHSLAAAGCRWRATPDLRSGGLVDVPRQAFLAHELQVGLVHAREGEREIRRDPDDVIDAALAYVPKARV